MPQESSSPGTGIVFDAEGVIVDTEPLWDRAQAELLARYGVVYERDRVKHLLTGRSGAEGARVLKDVYALSPSPEALEAERKSIMERELRAGAPFVPGFRSFFEKVRDRYATCVATSMDLDLLDAVRVGLGLDELFPGRIFTLADVGFVSKPNPDLFLFAARAIGIPPARCVVLEDSPYGIEAAARAGMRSVGITTTYGPDRLAAADVVVGSYPELEASGILPAPSAG